MLVGVGEQAERGEAACGLPPPHLSRHPFHGSPERKPSGIPSSAILRSRFLNQFQLSFSGCRVGPRAFGEVGEQTTGCLSLRNGGDGMSAKIIRLTHEVGLNSGSPS